MTPRHPGEGGLSAYNSAAVMSLFAHFMGKQDWLFSISLTAVFLPAGYVFARYQIGQRLFLGGRYDYVQDPTADGRTMTAGSGYLEWFPSEFSKLVAAYERFMPPGADAVNRILLQASFALGPHKPHPF